MLEINQLAELRTIYPENPNLKFGELLLGISKHSLYKVATYLIGQNLYSNVPLETQDVLSNWFSESNREFSNEMLKRIENYEKDHGRKLTITSIIGALKILQYGLDLDEAGQLNEKTNEQSEIDLFLAMLAINQEEDENHTGKTDIIKGFFPEQEQFMPSLLVLMNFATQDITDFHLPEYSTAQTIKALMLFQHLETIEIGTEILNRFCSYYKIDNWRDYFLRVFPIILSWVNRKTGSAVDIVLEQNDEMEANIEFLNQLALNDYIKVKDLDYIKLREKPLIQIDQLTYRVIHPLFIVDKIFKGLFFLLKQLSDSEPKLVEEFRSWYTSNFSEDVCFAGILNYAIPNFTTRFFDKELQALDIVGPSDCYLRIQNDIFLFENKDIFIGAGIKSAYDFEALVSELKKKLLVKQNTPVGIGQLVTNIRKLLDKSNNFDEDVIIEDATIYPIIVLHDQMFDTPGLNKLLDKFFQDELIKLREDGLDTSKVKPLVLLNIDTLIHISPILKNGAISLKELIDNYYNMLTVPNPFIGNQQQLEQAMQDTNLSFNHFVHEYLNYTYGIKWRSRELFNDLMDKSGF